MGLNKIVHGSYGSNMARYAGDNYHQGNPTGDNAFPNSSIPLEECKAKAKLAKPVIESASCGGESGHMFARTPLD